MKEKISIQGRSLVFNIVFIAINLLGFTFIILGYHKNFEESSSLFLLLGLIMLIASTAGIILFKGRLMMSSVARVLVGGLFIVSGLIKANDPIGFSYKLEEYFEDGALAFRIKEWFSSPGFTMEFFMDYALFLSVLICIAEIVLGVLTIIGGKIKIVSYAMLLLMIFFTFLTWHTANCDGTVKFKDRDTYAMSDPVAAMKIEEAKTNKALKIVSKTNNTLVVDEMKLPQCVDDCGCFGDAMKASMGRSLTPKESLWKDITLVYLVIWIFLAQWSIRPNTRKENRVFILSSVAVVIFFSWVFSWYFPVLFALVSLLAALWILKNGGKYLGNYWGSALLVTILCLIFEFFILRYSPMKDYRPYAVGSNLVEKTKDGVEGVYESMLVYKNKKTGKTKEYSSTSKEYTDSKIWEDSDWVYESMVQKEIIATKIPSITEQFNPFIGLPEITEHELTLDFVKDALANTKIKAIRVKEVEGGYISDVPMEEFNLTDYETEYYTIIDTVEVQDPNITDISIREFILSAPKIVVISSKTLLEGDWSEIESIKQIFKDCKKKNVPFVVMCGASREDIEKFRKKHAFYAPFFVNDETEMKAISRSNPAMLVIEKGIVVGKYSQRTIPSSKAFKTKYLGK